MIELVARLAGHGLPGAAPLEVALDHDQGRRLLADARAEKLVGLLDQAVAGGAVRVPDEVADEIGDAAVDVAAWCLLVERHLLQVHDQLGGAGIEHRFLKGATLAHRIEPHPALRTFVDVDVLVPGADIDRAMAVLLGADHVAVQPEFRRGHLARYGKSITLRSAPGVEVDLHRVLASGPYGLVRGPEPLWARPAAAVALGGRSVPCLDLVSAGVHACVHATTGARTHLATWRDVARLLPIVDAEEVGGLADELQVGGCVTRAAARAGEVLGLAADRPGAALARRPIGRRDRRWLDLYERRGGSFRHLALAGLGAVPGVGGKVAYARTLLEKH